MKWEELKNFIEQCVSEELLENYPITIWIGNSGAVDSDTRIEINNGKCEIFVTDLQE